MTPFERDVIDRLGRIETKLNADFATLHGNGQPGLVQKQAALETRVSAIEFTCKSREPLKKQIDEVEQKTRSLETNENVRERGISKFLKFTGWLVTALTAAYAAWKSNKGM